MLTGTVNLRWSAGNINHFSDDLVFQIHEDLDVLEMEEREKVVKHMWDVYNNGCRIRLPRFWQEAFEAAYEELTSDSPDVVDSAVAEIARMSIRSVVTDPPPLHSTFIVISFGYYTRRLRLKLDNWLSLTEFGACEKKGSGKVTQGNGWMRMPSRGLRCKHITKTKHHTYE